MKDKLHSYAVITGAGKGLGQAFASEMASRGYNVILVSLPGEGLSDQCRILESEFGIKAYHFEGDLTNTHDIEILSRWIENNFNISVLINNAGFGGSGEFDKSDLENLDRMILLNVRATTWVTHKLMPLLRLNRHCYVLNVSSMASFSPFAFKAVYSASKVYVEYLSKGLNKEFKGKGVHICSVHPGPMATNPEVTERIKRQTAFSRIGVETPEYVARLAIRRMFKGSPLIIIGKGNRIHRALMKTLPSKLVLSLLTYGMKKELFGQQTIVNQ